MSSTVIRRRDVRERAARDARREGGGERRRGGPDAPERGNTLGWLLRSLYEALQAEVYAAVRADGHPGLREAHSPVLRHLPPGGARVADVARRCGYAKQSIGYVVDDLAQLGYVTIAPDEQDGRAKRVRLSARGRALVDSLARHSAAAEARLARTLGGTAVERLRATLERAVSARPSANGTSATESGT